MTENSVVVLAGGVGAARFLEGVVQAVDPSRVTVIVNTGDDAEFYGLSVSPDVDIVLYTLAGIVEPSQGWGVQGDSYAVLEMLERLGRERRVLPMSDQPVRTTIRTPDGWLPFQEYFVRRRQQDDVLEIRYDGADQAVPAPGLLDAINGAR